MTTFRNFVQFFCIFFHRKFGFLSTIRKSIRLGNHSNISAYSGEPSQANTTAMSQRWYTLVHIVISLNLAFVSVRFGTAIAFAYISRMSIYFAYRPRKRRIFVCILNLSKVHFIKRWRSIRNQSFVETEMFNLFLYPKSHSTFALKFLKEISSFYANIQ